MTAEAVAKVVADLKAARVDPPRFDHEIGFELAARSLAIVGGPVVDVSQIYQSILKKDSSTDLYADFPCILSPWENALYGWVNQYNNVFVASVGMIPKEGGYWPDGDHWDADNIPDWNVVEWIVIANVFIGGMGQSGRHIRTTGPIYAFRYALDKDGAPLDIHWIYFDSRFYGYEGDEDQRDAVGLVLLNSLNFLNCRNIELVEPQRSRPERRRLERTGVTVKEINVFPVGRTSRSKRGDPQHGGVPLTSVRGHFAMYGPKYGRGLLFGKIEGRFWIPQHARGSTEFGENETNYKLIPEKEKADG